MNFNTPNQIFQNQFQSTKSSPEISFFMILEQTYQTRKFCGAMRKKRGGEDFTY